MSINYDETMASRDDMTGAWSQVPKWKFRPGQRLWWWNSLALRLHPCTVIRADYATAAGGKWIIDYDGERPAQVYGRDLYETKDVAVATAIASLDASLENSRVQHRKQEQAIERARKLLE